MSALPSIPPKAEQEAEADAAELELDGADSGFRSIPVPTSTPDETFEEELLREAFLPKDGGA